MTGMDAGSEKVWSAIENEKRRDRFVRRTAVAAWTATFVLIVALGAQIAANTLQATKLASVGALSWSAVFQRITPFVIVLGVVALLIAVLSTVGVFLRMRTTTLSEIQLRLAALEQILSARPDAG